MKLFSVRITVSAVLLFLSSPSVLYATYTSTISGSTATMTGDAASDTLIIGQTAGLYSHNRFAAGDPGFNSQFDFNSAVPGDQTLSTSDTITVNSGDGNDSVVVGDAVNLGGTVDGGPGTDTLDYSMYTSGVRANLGLGTTGLTANLTADQQNPPTTHAGTGTASITNYNIVTRTFDITVNVSGLLPADVAGFHIHQSPVGVDGPVIVDFTGVAPLVPSGNGFTFTATGLSMPALSEAAFLGGGTYVNIHTAAFPVGAIRGQLFSSGNVNLATGAATGTSGLSNFENLTGGSSIDSLVGNFSANTVNGGPGADWIVGGPGADTLNGDAGADVLVWSGGDGSDTIEGGTDSDSVQVNGGSADEDFMVSANGARLAFARTTPGPFSLDVGTVETLIVNGVGGSDGFFVNNLTGVAALSTVDFNGFEGDDFFAYAPTSSGAFVFNARGGPGSDALQGPNSASTWNVTAPDQGNIAGLVTFRFVEIFVGGTGSDTFNVKAFASGTPEFILGGTTGPNTLNYDAELRTVSGDTTPPDGFILSPGVQDVSFLQIQIVNILNQSTLQRRRGQITAQ